MEINTLPTNLEEAVETLEIFYSSQQAVEEIKNMSLKKFEASSHFGAGMFIRNSWNLWWFEGHKYPSWPKEKPKLIEWFNNIDIYHADDMSGILMECLWKKLHNQPYELEKQIERYKKHWRQAGFKDGIFNPNKK